MTKRPNQRTENKKANDAAKAENLSKDEKRNMHDDPQMADGLSYKKLREIARDQKK